MCQTVKPLGGFGVSLWGICVCVWDLPWLRFCGGLTQWSGIFTDYERDQVKGDWQSLSGPSLWSSLPLSDLWVLQLEFYCSRGVWIRTLSAVFSFLLSVLYWGLNVRSEPLTTRQLNCKYSYSSESKECQCISGSHGIEQTDTVPSLLPPLCVFHWSTTK